jgi:hypothetical protein
LAPTTDSSLANELIEPVGDSAGVDEGRSGGLDSEEEPLVEIVCLHCGGGLWLEVGQVIRDACVHSSAP